MVRFSKRKSLDTTTKKVHNSSYSINGILGQNQNLPNNPIKRKWSDDSDKNSPYSDQSSKYENPKRDYTYQHSPPSFELKWEVVRPEEAGTPCSEPQLSQINTQPPNVIIPQAQYHQSYTSSPLSPVSASLYESISNIQYTSTENTANLAPLTPLSIPDEKSQLTNIIKESNFSAGNSPVASPYCTSPVTTKEFYQSKVEIPENAQYLTEVQPASPAQPQSHSSAHVEAMLTTLQPINPSNLLSNLESPGFGPTSLFGNYYNNSYNQYSPYYSYSGAPVSLKWN